LSAELRGTIRLMRLLILLAFVVVALVLAGTAASISSAPTSKVVRIDHVADGDTVDLTNGAKVRLVQIDTPEVYFHPECYGKKASALTKRLLPSGTAVQLTREPATDSADSYGRLLRYVIRRRDGLNINVHLVALGAAAPYFYRGRRGRYATKLTRLALRARRRHLGLWGQCPGTLYNPNEGVSTGPPR
jgi:micrococcal nuclease